jgi:hypothetical protein
MVAALPEATTPTPTPHQGFLNVYGSMVDAEQALELTEHIRVTDHQRRRRRARKSITGETSIAAIW